LGLPEADADDATQEVLLVIARRLPSIREGRERAFALSTAFRIGATFRRVAGRRESNFELEDVRDPKPEPDAALDQRRALELLDHILGDMSLELRAVFIAAEFEGLSLNDMSEVFGIPRGTVASRLRAARQDFRARVARHEAKARNMRGER